MHYKKFCERNNSEIPLRIVCATREKIENFENTMLGKSLLPFSILSDLEIFVESENKNSLTKVYNEVIEQSRNNPAILIFVHDDVLITDLFWEKTIRESLSKFDILGLAGTTRRLPKQASWCMITPDLTVGEKSEFLSGMVCHGKSFPPKNVGAFGKIGKKCKLLDGLFFAVKSETLIKNNLKFDERFNFHFYDLDFCRQAEILNLSMGTVPITVVHGSEGVYDDNWKNMYNEYLKKWKE